MKLSVLLLLGMATKPDHILIVESDPLISDLVGRQTLAAAGYRVSVVTDPNEAILQAVKNAPDVILANITLPGLTGIDLLVALGAQGINTPVVLLAKKGLENEIIHSIRLGAADYLVMPARETEILTVVERILKRVRDSRERQRVDEQLLAANRDLERQLRERSALLDLGKDLTAAGDAHSLPARIVERFCLLLQADTGWLLIKEETSKAMVLAAQRNLPKSLPVQLDHPWDDGVSQMVSLSGEPLAIHGERLARHKIAGLGAAALVLPLKIDNKVAASLVLVRVQNHPFGDAEQRLAMTAADFAAIGLANARLSRAASERSHQQEQLSAAAITNERITSELLHKVKRQMGELLDTQKTALTNLNENLTRPISQYQREQFDLLQITLDGLLLLNADIAPPKTTRPQRAPRSVNLHESVRRTYFRFESFAQPDDINFSVDLPEQLVFVQSDEEWLNQALDGLVSNAIKFCSPGGSVSLRVAPPENRLVHLIIANSNPTIQPEFLARVFSGAHSEAVQPHRPGGLGVSMPLIKDIITRINGKIWVESKSGQGVQFHIILPAQ